MHAVAGFLRTDKLRDKALSVNDDGIFIKINAQHTLSRLRHPISIISAIFNIPKDIEKLIGVGGPLPPDVLPS